MNERDDWRLTDRIEHETGEGDPFAAAVRATRMPMVITDPARDDNPIIFCNAAFQELTGYSREEILGRNCRFLQGPGTDSAAVATIREAIDAGSDVSVDLLNYRKDGTTFWNALYLSPVHNAAGAIQFFFASQLDISDRVAEREAAHEQTAAIEREVERQTRELRAALDARTLLLHEVDHRVKNNLTMIGSLLRLQARTIDDPTISNTLEAMLERVDALASIHRQLYQSDDISRFDAGAYLASLAADIVTASGRGDIKVDCAVEPIPVAAGRAAALGLVVNEALTNAIKHAYADGRSGTLEVHANRDGDDALLAIADDGPGIDVPAEGLGMTLIKRLSRQAGATVEWVPLDQGTRVEIRFAVER